MGSSLRFFTSAHHRRRMRPSTWLIIGIAIVLGQIAALDLLGFVDAAAFGCSTSGETLVITSESPGADIIVTPANDCNVIIKDITVSVISFTTAITNSNITVENIACVGGNAHCIDFSGQMENIGFIVIRNVSKDYTWNDATSSMAIVRHAQTITGITISYTLQDIYAKLMRASNAATVAMHVLEFQNMISGVNQLILLNNYFRCEPESSSAGANCRFMTTRGVDDVKLILFDNNTFNTKLRTASLSDASTALWQSQVSNYNKHIENITIVNTFSTTASASSHNVWALKVLQVMCPSQNTPHILIDGVVMGTRIVGGSAITAKGDMTVSVATFEGAVHGPITNLTLRNIDMSTLQLKSNTGNINIFALTANAGFGNVDYISVNDFSIGFLDSISYLATQIAPIFFQSVTGRIHSVHVETVRMNISSAEVTNSGKLMVMGGFVGSASGSVPASTKSIIVRDIEVNTSKLLGANAAIEVGAAWIKQTHKGNSTDNFWDPNEPATPILLFENIRMNLDGNCVNTTGQAVKVVTVSFEEDVGFMYQIAVRNVFIHMDVAKSQVQVYFEPGIRFHKAVENIYSIIVENVHASDFSLVTDTSGIETAVVYAASTLSNITHFVMDDCSLTSSHQIIGLGSTACVISLLRVVSNAEALSNISITSSSVSVNSVTLTTATFNGMFVSFGAQLLDAGAFQVRSCSQKFQSLKITQALSSAGIYVAAQTTFSAALAAADATSFIVEDFSMGTFGNSSASNCKSHVVNFVSTLVNVTNFRVRNVSHDAGLICSAAVTHAGVLMSGTASEIGRFVIDGLSMTLQPGISSSNGVSFGGVGFKQSLSGLAIEHDGTTTAEATTATGPTAPSLLVQATIAKRLILVLKNIKLFSDLLQPSSAQQVWAIAVWFQSASTGAVLSKIIIEHCAVDLTKVTGSTGNLALLEVAKAMDETYFRQLDVINSRLRVKYDVTSAIYVRALRTIQLARNINIVGNELSVQYIGVSAPPLTTQIFFLKSEIEQSKKRIRLLFSRNYFLPHNDAGCKLTQCTAVAFGSGATELKLQATVTENHFGDSNTGTVKKFAIFAAYSTVLAEAASSFYFHRNHMVEGSLGYVYSMLPLPMANIDCNNNNFTFRCRNFWNASKVEDFEMMAGATATVFQPCREVTETPNETTTVATTTTSTSTTSSTSTSTTTDTPSSTTTTTTDPSTTTTSATDSSTSSTSSSTSTSAAPWGTASASTGSPSTMSPVTVFTIAPPPTPPQATTPAAPVGSTGTTTTTTASASPSAAASTPTPTPSAAPMTAAPLTPTQVETTTTAGKTEPTTPTTPTSTQQQQQHNNGSTTTPEGKKNSTGVEVVPVESSALTTTAVIGATIATAGAVGPLAVRNSILRQLSTCGKPLEPLGPDVNPTRLTVGGSDNPYRWWNGVILGNSALIAGLTVAAVIAVNVYARYKKIHDDKEAIKKPVAIARAVIGCFMLIMAGPITVGATAAFVHGPEGVVLVGVFLASTVLVILPLAVPLWVFKRLRDCNVRVVETVREDKISSAKSPGGGGGGGGGGKGEEQESFFHKLGSYLFAPRNGKDWEDDAQSIRVNWAWVFDHSCSLRYLILEHLCGFSINIFAGMMQNPELPMWKCQIYSCVICAFHAPPTFLNLFFNSLITRCEMIVITLLWLGNTLMSMSIVFDMFGVTLGSVLMDVLTTALAAINLAAALLAIWSSYDALTVIVRRKRRDEGAKDYPEDTDNFLELEMLMADGGGGPGGDAPGGGRASAPPAKRATVAASDSVWKALDVEDMEIDLSMLNDGGGASMTTAADTPAVTSPPSTAGVVDTASVFDDQIDLTSGGAAVADDSIDLSSLEQPSGAAPPANEQTEVVTSSDLFAGLPEN